MTPAISQISFGASYFRWLVTCWLLKLSTHKQTWGVVRRQTKGYFIRHHQAWVYVTATVSV